MISFIFTRAVPSFDPQIIDSFIDLIKISFAPNTPICVTTGNPYFFRITHSLNMPTSTKYKPLISTDTIYTVKMEHSSYTEQNFSTLAITIESNSDLSDSNTPYDLFLEKLKIFTKNELLKLWKSASCTWIRDDQSATLSHSLYIPFNRVENGLRAFITHVMIHKFGPLWWKKIATMKLKNKHNERKPGYCRVVHSFNNVDDFLLALDADELKEILELKVHKWVPQFTDEIEAAVKSSNAGRLLALMSEQLQTTTSLWEDVFSIYFPKEFLRQWIDLCKNRNHIAHNKFIDFQAHQKFQTLIDNVEGQIMAAFRTYETRAVSDETRQAWVDEFLKIDFSSIVDIDDDIAIHNLLDEMAETYLGLIRNSLYLREDIVVSEIDYDPLPPPFHVNDTMLMSIKDRSSDNELSVHADKFKKALRYGEPNSLSFVLKKNGVPFDEISFRVIYYQEIIDTALNEMYYPDPLFDAISEDDFEKWFSTALHKVFPLPSEKTEEPNFIAPTNEKSRPLGNHGNSDH